MHNCTWLLVFFFSRDSEKLPSCKKSSDPLSPIKDNIQLTPETEEEIFNQLEYSHVQRAIFQWTDVICLGSSLLHGGLHFNHCTYIVGGQSKMNCFWTSYTNIKRLYFGCELYICLNIGFFVIFYIKWNERYSFILTRIKPFQYYITWFFSHLNANRKLLFKLIFKNYPSK